MRHLARTRSGRRVGVRARRLFIGVPLLLVTAGLVPAVAQTADPALAVRNSCQKESLKYCGGKGDGGAMESACLRQYYTNLSPACRNALRAQAAQKGGSEGEEDTGTDHAR
jgi:hypothetical protein